MPAWSLRNILRAVAILLGLLAVVAWLAGGVHLGLGPFGFSASSAARVALEAAVVWLVAELTAPLPTRVLLATIAVLLSGIADATPQRIGDGAEYVGMALNMSWGGAPALLPHERDAVTKEMRALQGFEDAALDTPLIGRDGRQDVYHFWLYPLVVAPFAALARIFDVHVNHAFTAVNLFLIGALIWWLQRRGHVEAAALLTIGPILWWIDKAHTEVFIFVLLAFAALLVDLWPAASLMAAGLAAAQNPGAVVVLAVCLVSTMLRTGGRAGFAAFAALAIAAVAPVYYHWHLGVWSPLSTTLGWTVPSVRALLTPLFDPNLGLIVYAPVLALLACVGATAHTRRSLLFFAATTAGLLVVFAESGNVNHGGTPGVSRYALWLLAIASPLIVSGVDRLRADRPAVWRAAAVVSVLLAVSLFRPAWADRAGSAPNRLAAALWTEWPAVDNPLPEIFAERMTGIDGSPAVPIATGGCEKILTRGDGNDAWFPVPCQPRPAPPACVAAGQLCYVNDGRYARAPRQATFTFEASPHHAWTWRNSTRLDPLLRQLGSGVRFVRLSEPGGRIDAVRGVTHLYVVEGSAGAAAWVRSMSSPPEGVVRVAVSRLSTLMLLDADTLSPLEASRTLGAGDHEVGVPRDVPSIVVVSDAK